MAYQEVAHRILLLSVTAELTGRGVTENPLSGDIKALLQVCNNWSGAPSKSHIPTHCSASNLSGGSTRTIWVSVSASKTAWDTSPKRSAWPDHVPLCTLNAETHTFILLLHKDDRRITRVSTKRVFFARAARISHSEEALPVFHPLCGRFSSPKITLLCILFAEIFLLRLSLGARARQNIFFCFSPLLDRYLSVSRKK